MNINANKLKELAISESGLIFDPASGSIYTSNQVGLGMIAALREGLGKDEIVQRITDEFDVSSDIVERDLFDFCGQLMGYGVIDDV